MSFKVLTDTSSNLPARICKKYDIDVVPFHFYINGVEEPYVDIEEFDGPMFYKKIRKGAVVTTSQINPSNYSDFFETYLAQGLDVLYVSMASGISSSFASANIAANELREKYPDRTISIIDSMTASLGEGIPAIRAAECREKGMSIDETTVFMKKLCTRTHSVFTVDDLMCLKRGGRLSNLGAVAGILLNIKPILKGSEKATIVSIAKVRGRKHSIEALAERYNRLVRNPDLQTVGIAHADCQEDADYLISLINKVHPPKEILTVMYEPVTGAHVGPGALALFFEAFDGVRLEN